MLEVRHEYIKALRYEQTKLAEMATLTTVPIRQRYTDETLS